jgi:rhamnogalacturonan endolyase
MSRMIALLLLLSCVPAPTAVAQQPAPQPTPEERPASSIPPNFSHYTLNPNPRPTVLGWAAERVEEKLGRGVSALRKDAGSVYVSWRLLKSDPPDAAFNVYRSTAGGAPVKLNAEPVRQTTDFLDAKAPADRENSWWVRAVVGGREQEPSVRATLAANSPARQYRAFRVRDDIPAASIDKIGVGDLDGDGEYDFVVKRPAGVIDPSFLTRHSPDTFKIEAYKSDGTFLWRRDLGWSIQLGIWFSPFQVADLDGDGRAEVAIKTGEGDPRDRNGQVLTGPEYLSVWDGLTGKDIDRVDWIPRGKLSDWGDYSGNRSNRHMMAVAYLDGKTPSVVIFRGTYGLMKAEAFFLKDKKLHKVWSWTNERAGWRYQGQGQHAVHVADLDGDGADEVLNGSIAIDGDGRTMWSTGNGHGDRFYVTDIDPARPGLEIWYTYEDPHPRNGVGLWDARTGNLIFGTDEETADNQVGSGLVADIDPNHPGMEVWAERFFYTAKGERLPGPVPPQQGLVWWDADPLRELHTFGRRGGQAGGGPDPATGGTVSKWKGAVLTEGIQGRHMLWGDIAGDWREEIVTFADGEVRIYGTVIPAADRRVTLMQDPLYRREVGLVVQGYVHVPVTSFYLGAR